MDTVRLVDAIVRHTTALIAQLSTSAGIRAPLANIADQVFLDLSREIEAQGVSRKVVASMFGLALRGYQRKVQRLTESTSHKGKTLWEAVVEHLDQHGPTLRADLVRRFEADGEDHVAAVLRDLGDSGVVYSTGRGDAAIYGLSSEQDRERILLETRGANLRFAAWYAIYRKAQSFGELVTELRVEEAHVEAAVRALVAEGLVSTDRSAVPHRSAAEGFRETVTLLPTTRLESRRFLVPTNAEHGWEVAVFDHYRAVLDAIAAKLRLRGTDPERAKLVGGATLVFDVHANHPMKAEVLGLLERVRRDVNDVWDRVSAYNKGAAVTDAQLMPVTFYFGQNVQLPSEESSDV